MSSPFSGPNGDDMPRVMDVSVTPTSAAIAEPIQPISAMSASLRTSFMNLSPPVVL